jgi:hypothetical protein
MFGGSTLLVFPRSRKGNTKELRGGSVSLHRFPREIISHGVWLYHRFSLSLRDARRTPGEAGDHRHPRVPHGSRGVIRNLFNLGRHDLSSGKYRLWRGRSFKERNAATAD